MNIPSSITSLVKEKAGPMDNVYFYHAISAYESLSKVTEKTYCYDHVSMVANTLERLYKGFLMTASEKCDWYSLPSARFLSADHDILGMVLEIKQNFPDVFPRQDRQSWRETKSFLRDLRQEYTSARYTSYPTYQEFVALRGYLQSQYNLISTYVTENDLSKQEENEFSVDY